MRISLLFSFFESTFSIGAGGTGEKLPLSISATFGIILNFEVSSVGDFSVAIKGTNAEGFEPFHFSDRYTHRVFELPIPGAVWLLGSGIVGIIGLRKKMNG